MMFYGIRGAITVNKNSQADIIEGTTLLLNKTLEENRLNKESIISIIFSATKDLNAEYPAVAARELGMADIPLFCCQEMYVEDSMPKCIRILMHINGFKGKKIRHVYMKEAKKLRPDLISKDVEYKKEKTLSIAIDGPAGAGKSTIAKIIANKLDILYLDTGAMYRAIAYKAIGKGVNLHNKDDIINLLDGTNINVEYKNKGQRTLLDSLDITDKIRTPQVSEAASAVAAIPEVRLYLTELQREIAKSESLVIDGRDIGTYVLPGASYKFFLTATLNERAERRWKELSNKDNNISVETIRSQIEARDSADSSRAFAPLKKAKDAILIDTTGKTICQVSDEILQFIDLDIFCKKRSENV